jgi:hypothetical protein
LGGTRCTEGRHRGDQQHRGLGVDAAGQARKRRHPLGRDASRRTNPIVRQAIPSREGHDLDVGREEPEGVGEGRHAAAVTGDEYRQAFAGADDVGHDQGVEALGRADQIKTAGIGRNPAHLGCGDRTGIVSRHDCHLWQHELRTGML